MQSHQSQTLQKNLRLQFYKLHYPNKNTQNIPYKIKSNSVKNVISSLDDLNNIIRINQKQYEDANINEKDIKQKKQQKGNYKNNVIRRNHSTIDSVNNIRNINQSNYINNMNSINHINQINNVNNEEEQQDRTLIKYRQKYLAKPIIPSSSSLSTNNNNTNTITTRQSSLIPLSPSKPCTSFRQTLSPRISPESYPKILPQLPIKSTYDIQSYCSKNLTLKIHLQEYKKQKNMINSQILSHKQTQQQKLKYLQEKQKQFDEDIHKEIYQIYQRYFKKQYQRKYNKKDVAYREFQKNINLLSDVIGRNVLM